MQVPSTGVTGEPGPTTRLQQKGFHHDHDKKQYARCLCFIIVVRASAALLTQTTESIKIHAKEGELHSTTKASVHNQHDMLQLDSLKSSMHMHNITLPMRRALFGGYTMQLQSAEDGMSAQGGYNDTNVITYRKSR